MEKPKYRRNNEVYPRAIHTVSLVQNSSAVEIKSEKVIFSLPDPDKIFVFQRTTFRLNTSLTGFSRLKENTRYKNAARVHTSLTLANKLGLLGFWLLGRFTAFLRSLRIWV